KYNGILHVVGQGYVSTGGFETTKEFVAKMEFVTRSPRYLVVVSVETTSTWLRISVSMLLFEVADCTIKTYPDNCFDVIWNLEESNLGVGLGTVFIRFNTKEFV
ncbi:hypothetical protein HID58_079461, partial [Brassica napus]